MLETCEIVLYLLSCDTRSYVYKGHVVRDTFLRLVTFPKKIRDRLVLGINYFQQFLWNCHKVRQSFGTLQRSAKVFVRGLVKFVPALA